MSLAGSVTKEVATRDTGAMLQFLAEQPEVADTKVGTTGYCLGGGLALNAAGRFPDRVGAAASFHGGHIASTAPDSPHLLADAMTATVYVGGAKDDASFDDEAFARMSAALTAAGVTTRWSPIRLPTASRSPTTRPSTRMRPSGTGRRSRSCTRPRSADCAWRAGW